MAIGQAATVRVGFHIGAGAFADARMAGVMALVAGIGFMAVSAAALVMFASSVFSLYLDASDPQRDASACGGASPAVWPPPPCC